MSRPASGGLGLAFDAVSALSAPRLRKRSSPERFWAKVSKGEGCWEWTGGKHSDGYGRLRWCGEPSIAHRVAYSLAKGPIPAGIVVRHSCDNPGCCNPDHLDLGTIGDNNRDIASRGRSNSHFAKTIGVANTNAKLTDELVLELRVAWVAGESIKSIAVRTGLAVGTVHPMLHGKTWRHVAMPEGKKVAS